MHEQTKLAAEVLNTLAIAAMVVGTAYPGPVGVALVEIGQNLQLGAGALQAFNLWRTGRKGPPMDP